MAQYIRTSYVISIQAGAITGVQQMFPVTG